MTFQCLDTHLNIISEFEFGFRAMQGEESCS